MRRFTKWIPFGNYSYGDADYIVFVRKNKKTGILQFKTKTTYSFFSWKSSYIPNDLINVKEQWQKILLMD